LNLLFDTSVWVEHLRRGALDGVIPLIRGRFILWFDSIAGAELVARRTGNTDLAFGGGPCLLAPRTK
jgi:hypothetical protein